MKIGFVAWNRFQVAQVAPILQSQCDAVLIFQSDRAGADTTIPASPPEWCSVLSITRQATAELDGIFDAVLTQTTTPETADFSRTKVIAVQYSMAKERHQYGPWHFMTDGRLAYGPYSNDILNFYGNSFSVGNPRFDVLFNGQADPEIQAKIAETLSPDKKTVLYVPTYGKLSSFESFSSSIPELSERFNLIISGHHNTLLREKERSKVIEELGLANSADITPYYYDAADLVVSDYSGAIFDALLVQRPVVLFRPDHGNKIGVENLTADSIEVAREGAIGPVVRSSSDIADCLEATLDNHVFAAANAELRKECFANVGTASEAAYSAIIEIVNDTQAKPKVHQWVKRVLKGPKKTK